MMNIQDVSPTWSNLNRTNGSFPNGRMLSLACSEDAQTVFAGSLSNNVWASGDGGRAWEQLTWPQPPPDQFDVPGSMGGFCVTDMAVSPDSGRWQVDRAPRVLADLTGNGRADIVGFGESGVWTALSKGDGTFHPAQVVLANFGFHTGNWTVDKHPRFVADLTGNGYADIIGFANGGVWTALGNGDGTFQPANLVLQNFGYEAGDWSVEKHVRLLADLRGIGRADIVGFGDAGVYVALSNGNGTFTFQDDIVLANFAYETGNWRVDKHPRFLANLTDSGHADIIGFANAGVWTALGNGDGTFQEANLVLEYFGYEAGDWRVEKHPRFLAPLTSNGRADIVGFGEDGVYVALSNGDGTFSLHDSGVAGLGYGAAWRVEKHPRMLADLRGIGRADIVGFGDAGVYVALGNGDGSFSFQPTPVIANFGYEAGGWLVERHPRFLADLTGTGRADIVGFGEAGVWTALSSGAVEFQGPNFAIANFGYQNAVLAIARSDRERDDAGIWRSTDGGGNWTRVHQFPRTPLTLLTSQPPAAGQLVWALGSGNVVYAAGGSALAISVDGGATFTNLLPLGGGGFAPINHVAVAQLVDGTILPGLVYALGDNVMFVSYDGGANWIRDIGPLPPDVGGAVGLSGSQAASVLVVSPRCALEVFLATNGNAVTASILWRGNYLPFLGSHQSVWEQVPIPDFGNPVSGNTFLQVTQPGRGDLLFFGPRTSRVYVAPLNVKSASDWRPLYPDGEVHIDLHGILLSPDFEATFADGAYEWKRGAVWVWSDGGIHWSHNGGAFMEAAQNVRTLSCVNVAGVSTPGFGPALSLNTGDNDGFYSFDGGQHWTSQDYGGGDNDCAYADPLQPYMLMFTPRWNTDGVGDLGSKGQTVAIYLPSQSPLPDARLGTMTRHVVPGPPLVTSGDGYGNAWNANSGYGLRGFRPIVLKMPADDASAPGDYTFIRFKDDGKPVLLRTRNIGSIHSRDDWDTTATSPNDGAPVFQQGLPLHSTMGVVQASGGHTRTVFYVGGCTEGVNTELWKWTDGMADWQQIVPGGGAGSARRFFVNPYDRNQIYLLDERDIKRSDDGGTTWHRDVSLEKQLTCGGRIPVERSEDVSGQNDHVDVVLTDIQFDPMNPQTRFAVGEGGAVFTNDGINWSRLLHTGALPGRPTNCYYDWISNPNERALYVAFAGRGVVKISPLPDVGLSIVPDVVGVRAEAAPDLILAAGLLPHFTGTIARYSLVISQSPGAGIVVDPGSTVTMVLQG